MICESIICGIDEAGRGPLAGPVCAASVILSSDFPFDILNDSKKMTPERRSEVRQIICKEALVWGIGWASHTEIDEINILQASLLAMKRSFNDMLKREKKKQLLLLGEDKNVVELKVIVDGKFIPEINISSPVKIICTPMVKADASIPQVMAASILAKTERDVYMNDMAKLYPQYGYEKHKGYPTKSHREAVLKYGPSPIQRLSFRVK